MPRRGPRKHPWHVVGYVSCPKCDNWSVGVQMNGRIVRHTEGFGYVERFPPNVPFRPGPLCKGSGMKVDP